ncbi:hypothetical protein ACLBYN_68115, partial [Pseudomonas aeruginosa]
TWWQTSDKALPSKAQAEATQDAEPERE